MNDEMGNQIEKAFKKEKLKAPQQKNQAAFHDTALLASETREIKKGLDLKADKVDLEKLFKIKTNRVDTENILDV